MPNFELFSDGSPTNEFRLEARHTHIISANLDAVRGKRVVDLAANNGRWSYAAVEAGASHVFSIEGREERLRDAQAFFAELGVSDKIDASLGDMYDYLRRCEFGSVDTVFCLGIYYHIMDHYMLLKHMADLKPQTIIIDSAFVRSFRNSVHIQTEAPDLHLNALSVYPGQKAEIVGFVSLGLMIQMAWNVGYRCIPVPWDPRAIERRETVQDYMMGRRFTLRLDKMSGASDPNWKEPWEHALRLLNPKFVELLDRKTHDRQVDARVRQPFESMQFSVM